MYDVERIEQAVASSIQGYLHPPWRLQPGVLPGLDLFDKMEITMIHYLNRILGRMINTRTMMVATPPDYFKGTIMLMRSHSIGADNS